MHDDEHQRVLRDERLRLLRLERVRRGGARCSPSSSSRCASRRRSVLAEARLTGAGRRSGDDRGSSRMKPRHRRFLWIGAGVVLLGAAAGARAQRVPVQPRLLLLADRRRREPRAAGPRVPHRRPGRGEEPDARGRRTHRALQRHRHRARRSPSSTPASFPTCSRKARASSRRARSAPTACSTPPRCSPSTTRTTCRPRPPPRSTRRTRARRWTRPPRR